MGKMYDKMIAVKDAAYNTGRGLGFAAAMYAATLFGCNNADKVEQPEPTPVVQQTETRPSYTTVKDALEKAEDIKHRLRTILLYEEEDDAAGHMTESEVQQFYELNEEFFSLRVDVKENELYDTGIVSNREKLKDMIGDIDSDGVYRADSDSLADVMERLSAEILGSTEVPVEVYLAMFASYGRPVEMSDGEMSDGFSIGGLDEFQLEGAAYDEAGDGHLNRLCGDNLQLVPLTSKIQDEWVAPTDGNTGLSRDSVYVRIDLSHYKEALLSLIGDNLQALPVKAETGQTTYLPLQKFFNGEMTPDSPEVIEAAIMLVRKDGDYTVRDQSLVDAVKALED